ncbi:MAG: glycine cleavage system aminomethyltransferase GcvT [Francisellaceae bacterium]
MGRKTPLYEINLQNNAKMVDFSGWDMPIHYGSQIEEHHIVRQSAGIFDVSHMLTVDCIGDEAHDFFKYLLANDIEKLVPGKAMYSCMLNEDGGIIDDLILYYLAKNYIRVVINAGNRESDVDWITEKARNFDVVINVRDDLAIIAVQGPDARVLVDDALGDRVTEEVRRLKPFEATKQGEWMVARTGYTGEDGYEVSLPAIEAVNFWKSLIQHGARPCGLGARDTLRLEAGMNLYGQDMDERITPMEAGLMWTVSLTSNRDFIGKSALQHKMNQVTHEFVGVVLSGRGVLRHGQEVVVLVGDNTHDKGVITSGTFSPTLKESIALARLPHGAKEIQVMIRNKPVAAQLVKYPFVRKGKKVYKELQMLTGA